MTLGNTRVLVTGASSFIGSALVQELSQQVASVHALTWPDQLPSNLPRSKNIMSQVVDITDFAAVKACLYSTKPDVIFHLAAYGTLSRERDIKPMVEVNVTGTHHLLAAAAEVGTKSLVYAGSVKEYRPSRDSIGEDNALEPWDEYAVAKVAAENLGRIIAQKTSLTFTSLRLSPVYGPADDKSRFVPVAVRAALSGEPFHISVGPLVRNFTHVTDVVTAFIAAGKHISPGFSAFNIGATKPQSFHDILDAIEDATGKKITRVSNRAVTSNDDSWVINSDKAAAILNWRPTFSLADGIAQTVGAYGQRKWSTSTVSSSLVD